MLALTCVYSESIKSVSRLMVDGMQVFNQPFMQNNEVLNMIMSVFKKLATEDLSKLYVVHMHTSSILCTLYFECYMQQKKIIHRVDFTVYSVLRTHLIMSFSRTLVN